MKKSEHQSERCLNDPHFGCSKIQIMHEVYKNNYKCKIDVSTINIKKKVNNCLTLVIITLHFKFMTKVAKSQFTFKLQSI